MLAGVTLCPRFARAGCSKTMMAKAMATEGHMNFIAVKGA
jgi:SpoVK/Ycf46/Vps4 family AAA+-type ATPase